MKIDCDTVSFLKKIIFYYGEQKYKVKPAFTDEGEAVRSVYKVQNCK